MTLTFREILGTAVHLQSVQRTDLQVNVIMEELLHYWLERQQQLLFFIHLLFTGRCKLLFVIIRVDLIGNVLQEAGCRGKQRQEYKSIVPLYVRSKLKKKKINKTHQKSETLSTAVPGYKNVDKTFVSVEFWRDVVFDPLVDGLW